MSATPRMPEVFTNHIAFLNETMTQYLETGVAVLEDDGTSDQLRAEGSAVMKSLLKRCAKDLGRPWIYARSQKWHPWTYNPQPNGNRYTRDTDTIESRLELTIPHTKRLECVTSALILVSVEPHNTNRYSGRYEAENMDAPVVRWADTRNYYFMFKGEAGHKIFDGFLEQCRTDPVFRVALKL